MNRDATLLADAEVGTLGARVYSWDGPWVSLGRSQSPERDLLPTNPVPHVIRPTGGQAVLHGHDITIGLAIPMDIVVAANPDEIEITTEVTEWVNIETGKLRFTLPGTTIDHRRSIRVVYRTATRPILEALRTCGLDVALAADTEWVREAHGLPDCFAATSELDIVDRATGSKICGCAMRRKRDAVLLQASVPKGQPLVDPSQVFADASCYVGPEWDSSGLRDALEAKLRYNFSNVPA